MSLFLYKTNASLLHNDWTEGVTQMFVMHFHTFPIVTCLGYWFYQSFFVFLFMFFGFNLGLTNLTVRIKLDQLALVIGDIFRNPEYTGNLQYSLCDKSWRNHIKVRLSNFTVIYLRMVFSGFKVLEISFWYEVQIAKKLWFLHDIKLLNA